MADLDFFNSSLSAQQIENTLTGIYGLGGLIQSNVNGTFSKKEIGSDIGLPTITGTIPPTISTAGSVGQMYYCSSNGAIYVCTGLNGSSYNWVLSHNANNLAMNICGYEVSYNGSEAKSITVPKPKLFVDRLYLTSNASSYQGAFNVTYTAGRYSMFHVNFVNYASGDYLSNGVPISNGTTGTIYVVGQTSLTRSFDSRTDGVLKFGDGGYGVLINQVHGIGITF